MSENTLQLRLQYFVGESLEEWLTRQRKIDIIQLAEGRPDIDTYSHDMELDEKSEVTLLNNELRETWGSILTLEESNPTWEQPTELKMGVAQWIVDDDTRKAIKQNKKVYNLKPYNRPFGWTPKWWENTPVHSITELR